MVDIKRELITEDIIQKHKKDKTEPESRILDKDKPGESYSSLVKKQFKKN